MVYTYVVADIVPIESNLYDTVKMGIRGVGIDDKVIHYNPLFYIRFSLLIYIDNKI